MLKLLICNWKNIVNVLKHRLSTVNYRLNEINWFFRIAHPIKSLSEPYWTLLNNKNNAQRQHLIWFWNETKKEILQNYSENWLMFTILVVPTVLYRMIRCTVVPLSRILLPESAMSLFTFFTAYWFIMLCKRIKYCSTTFKTDLNWSCTTCFQLKFSQRVYINLI